MKWLLVLLSLACQPDISGDYTGGFVEADGGGVPCSGSGQAVGAWHLSQSSDGIVTGTCSLCAGTLEAGVYGSARVLWMFGAEVDSIEETWDGLSGSCACFGERVRWRLRRK